MRYFDLHCDTILGCYFDSAKLAQNDLHVDFQRGRSMKPYVQCFAVFLPDDIHGSKAFHQFCQISDCFFQEIAENGDSVIRYEGPDDLYRAEEQEKCCAILTVENASALGGRVENVEEFARRGVKLCALTWNGENELGRGVGSQGSTGLTSFGREVVAQLEKHHIVPDLSHASSELFFDVVEVARGPLVATHSNAHKICGHPRNLTDEQFTIIKNTGGLVGLNLYGRFLRNSDKASGEDVLRHAEHFLSLGGENVLAFGADWDGGPAEDFPAAGIEDVEKIYELFLRHNYSETLIDKIFYSNAAEFFKRLDLF